ncbi:MAG TPA: ester cyclase [Nitrososphaeraceae archaeon]|nr:ester cyclase [Nitrososphaeraceae archaeon]
MASSYSSKQEEKNKRIVSQFFELLGRHDTERMEQLLVSSTQYSFHPSGMPHMDWNGHKQLLTTITRAFPDLHHEIRDMVAEGDKVAVRLNVTGTHNGEFQGIPPSGRKLSLDEMAFLTLIDGRITEGWITSDTMGFMQQIGAIPTPSTAGTSD